MTTTVHPGATIEAHGWAVRPVSKESHLRFATGPMRADWRWSRPSHIEVTESAGATRRISIRDHLLEVRLAVLAAVLLLLVLQRRPRT